MNKITTPIFMSVYRINEDNATIKLEAERKAGVKITHVTISSPLPVPVAAAQGE
ncbi:MAG: hypothetical protein QOH39_1269 [Verrucomicrobiota bacterium]|jgi:hypothetical protein